MISSLGLADSLSSPAPRSVSGAAARGVIWTTTQSLVNRLSGAVVFLLLARLLAPAEFGVMATALVFVSLSTTLAEAGLTRTLVQRTTLRAAHLDSALLVSGAVGAALSTAMLATAPFVADLYDLPRLTPVLMALAVIPLITGVSSVPESILRRQLRFRSLALRGTTSVVLSGAAGVALALSGAGTWALVGQTLSQSLIALVILWASVRWRPGRRWERSAMRELLGFGSNVLGISLLNFLTRRSGELLIGLVLGPTALGLYAVSVKLLNLGLDLMVANVQKVAFPVFSRMANDPERLRAGYTRAIGLTTMVAFPGFLLVSLLGEQLAPIVFGKQWIDAGPLIAVLALFGPAQSIAFFNNSVMLARGRSGLALGWTALNATTSLVTFSVTVQYGLLAAAVGHVARGWLMLPVGLYLVRRVSGIRLIDQIRAPLAPLLGCAVMASVVILIEKATSLPQAADLATAGAAGIVTYVLVMGVLCRQRVRALTRRLRQRRTAPA